MSRYKGISPDSRKVRERYIFVAIPGASLDGRDFMDDALKNGAKALVVPSSDFDRIKRAYGGKAAVYGASDTRKALALLSDAFYGHPSRKLSLVGITGTNGKTTTTFILEAILKRAGKNPGIIGTVNRRMGDLELPSDLSTPDSVTLQETLSTMVDRGAKAVVMEVSSHALQQQRVTGCLFKAGIFTNLTHDHLDYHGTMEDYFKSKSLLFLEHTPEVSVINVDDPHGKRLWNIIGETGISFGFGNEAMVRPIAYSFDMNGIHARLSIPGGELDIESPLLGKHNLYNILSAVATSLALGIPKEIIRAGIKDARNIPGRLERVAVKKGVTALVDYAHTPDALENILKCLRELKPERLICIVGCGGDRDRTKRPLMARIAASLSDVVVFTSDNPRSEAPETILHAMLKGLEDGSYYNCLVEVIINRKEAIRWAACRARDGDCILVAGKGHETYQIIGKKKYPFDDRKELLDAFRDIAPEMDILRLSEAAGAEIIKTVPGLKVKGVSTDSRTVSSGELFLSLKGEKFDGNKFAPMSVEKGASAVLIHGKDPALISKIETKNPDTAILSCQDTLKALGDIASWYRKNTGMKVVAVTGSCGKTTTKEIISSMLETRWVTARTKGNFNNLIGLPLSILQANTATEWAVLEMGMNQPGEIARLCEIASPDIALITTIQPAHLEGLGDINGVVREKTEVWKSLPSHGIAIVNLDDPYQVREAEKIQCRKIGFTMNMSTHCPDNFLNCPDNFLETRVACRSWEPEGKGARIELDVNGAPLLLKTRLVGRVNIQNIIAAVAVGHALGLDAKEMSEGLSLVRPVPGRLCIRDLGNDLRIIDDTYNANPSSMRAAIDVLKIWGTNGAKVAILGDMFELGDDSSSYHEELGEYLAKSGMDFLVAAGGFSEAVARGAKRQGLSPDSIHTYTDTQELIQWINRDFFKVIPSPCSILIKGSRGMQMETAVNEIFRKKEERNG